VTHLVRASDTAAQPALQTGGRVGRSAPSRAPR
jgi:hypothetical protein